MNTSLESAIAPHLRCPRTLERRCSEAYMPFKPGRAARFDPRVQRVVMAYFGVQYRDSAQEMVAREAVGQWKRIAARTDGPPHHDVAHYVDQAGFDTLLLVAYWDDAERFQAWLAMPELADWWDSPLRLTDGVGWFREIVCPEVERVETLFSGVGQVEGIAALGFLSEPIQEKGYWGSMRDRLAVAQTDRLEAIDSPCVLPAENQRVQVKGSENLALIRSGQEWSETEGEERRTYLEEVAPVLRKGMNFLRDDGYAIGCYTNRFMTHVDENFLPLEKTFGMSWWHTLADMERWAENHPSHIVIYGAFISMLKRLDFQIKLRLYHEVTVVRAQDQYFEYVSCHPATGLLRAGRVQENA